MVVSNLIWNTISTYSATPSPPPSPRQIQIKSNPLFNHVAPRSTEVLVKTCTCMQIRKLKIEKNILVTYTLLL